MPQSRTEAEAEAEAEAEPAAGEDRTMALDDSVFDQFLEGDGASYLGIMHHRGVLFFLRGREHGVRLHAVTGFHNLGANALCTIGLYRRYAQYLIDEGYSPATIIVSLNVLMHRAEERYSTEAEYRHFFMRRPRTAWDKLAWDTRGILLASSGDGDVLDTSSGPLYVNVFKAVHRLRHPWGATMRMSRPVLEEYWRRSLMMM